MPGQTVEIRKAKDLDPSIRIREASRLASGQTQRLNEMLAEQVIALMDKVEKLTARLDRVEKRI